MSADQLVVDAPFASFFDDLRALRSRLTDGERHRVVALLESLIRAELIGEDEA